MQSTQALRSVEKSGGGSKKVRGGLNRIKSCLTGVSLENLLHFRQKAGGYSPTARFSTMLATAKSTPMSSDIL